MIELDITDKQKLLEQHFHSIPEQWFYYATQCILEIETLLGVYGMTLDDIEIAEVKEKYGEFRFYYFLLAQTDDNLTDEQIRYYSCLDTMISCIVSKWERWIKADTQNGKLPNFYPKN